jgi:energy-coupling factor transport system ATP-binding protein
MIVLDEPTGGLDRRAADLVVGAIVRRRERAGSALLITHDLALVAAHATRVVVLADGQIRADGSPRDVLSDDRRLAGAGLAQPIVGKLARGLAAHGVRADALTTDEFCESYAAAWHRTRGDR